jgi:hypothetical protein
MVLPQSNPFNHQEMNKPPPHERDYCTTMKQSPAEQFIKDAAAFLRKTPLGHNQGTDNLVLMTLVHDIMGLDKNEPCFLPRVSGYAERESK